MPEYLCRNCAMFDQTDIIKEKEEMVWQEGKCRLNPPVIVYSPSVSDRLKGQWPIVLGTDWCSAWTPKGE
jgi:hypothetical protein